LGQEQEIDKGFDKKRNYYRLDVVLI